MDWRSQEQVHPIEAHLRGSGHIRLLILSSAARRRGTLLPLIAGLVALTYLLVLERIFGGRQMVGALLVLFLIIAAGSFIWRFVIQYADEYARHAHELMVREAEATVLIQRTSTLQFRERLHVGFSNVGSNEGLSALRALNTEWEQLQPTLQVRKATDPLALQHAAGLASETYQRGLSVLNDALDLMNAAGLTERKRLEWEIGRLQEDAEAAEDDPEPERIRQETLDLHTERLRRLEQLQGGADHLIHQARRCGASLQQTRVDIATMRLGGVDASIDAVVDALNGTIVQAKEVQEEFQRLGY